MTVRQWPGKGIPYQKAPAVLGEWPHGRTEGAEQSRFARLQPQSDLRVVAQGQLPPLCETACHRGAVTLGQTKCPSDPTACPCQPWEECEDRVNSL